MLLLLSFFIDITWARGLEERIASEERARSLRQNFCYESPHKKLNIAHRGNEREYMENSLPAFASAADLNANLIELDIVYTSDNKALVYHDPELNRGIINCGSLQNKKIRELTAAEIQANCKFTSEAFFRPTSELSPRPENLPLLANTNLNIHTPPLLEDVIEIVSPSTTGLLIEVKAFSQQGTSHETSLHLLDTLIGMDPHKKCEAEQPSHQEMQNTYGCFAKIKLMSFDIGLMDYLDQQIKTNPKYKRLQRTELLKLVGGDTAFEKLGDPAHAGTFWNLNGIAFNFRVGPNNQIDEDRLNALLTKIHCEHNLANGKKVFAWTAGNIDETEFLKNKKIDGIINSRPRDFPIYRDVVLPVSGSR